LSATGTLAVGYGLAVGLYGGYWLYLNRRTAKMSALIAAKKAR
jgi:hypothetical protein